MRTKLIMKGGLLALCGLAGQAFADPPLDGEFAEWGFLNTGKTVITFDDLANSTLTDEAADSVVGPDGSMYIAGTASTTNGTRIGIAKLDSQGTIAWKNRSLATDVHATSIALSDNMILVAGYHVVDINDRDFIVCRFSAVSGANINFPAPVNSACVKPVFFAGGRDEAADIAVQPDGKFVIGGTIGVGSASYAGFARFEANGQPDLGFGNIQGSNMTVVRNENIFAKHVINGIGIASNGKIVGVGETHNVGDPQLAGLMIRLNPDGTLEQGEFPFFLSPNPGATSMNDLVMVDDPNSLDDAVVAVGYRENQNGDQAGVITKISSNGGALVSAFGNSDGETTISIQGDLVFNRVAAQPGGNFVTVGLRPGSDVLDIEVRRFKHNGLGDSDFGNGGNVLVDFGFAGQLDLPAGISVHKDGVYFSGYSYLEGSNYDLVAGKLVLDRIFYDGVEIF